MLEEETQHLYYYYEGKRSFIYNSKDKCNSKDIISKYTPFNLIEIEKWFINTLALVPVQFCELTFNYEDFTPEYFRWKREGCAYIPIDDVSRLQSMLRNDSMAIIYLPDGTIKLCFGCLRFAQLYVELVPGITARDGEFVWTGEAKIETAEETTVGVVTTGADDTADGAANTADGAAKCSTTP